MDSAQADSNFNAKETEGIDSLTRATNPAIKSQSRHPLPFEYKDLEIESESRTSRALQEVGRLLFVTEPA